MSGRRERYTVQQVLDHLDGNFAIPEDGFDSDIEGFESDSDDDLEPQLPSQERENNDIDLRNVIIEDEEEEEAENSDVRAAGRPNNYSFDGLEWTDAPQDVPALPEFGENVGPAVVCSAEMSSLDYFLLLVDNRMLTSIVRETNRFVVLSVTDKGKDPNSWIDFRRAKSFSRFDNCHEHSFFAIS